MKFDKPKNRDFYFEYHRMGNRAFRDKVRYYEDNRSQVTHLSYEERIDVDLDYVLCLFEIGKYHKFLSKADSLIEIVITDNIYDYNGVNIYNDLLFKKAACLFNTGQYNKSEKVLKSITKLEPENNIARTLYGRCKRKQGRRWYETTKSIAIVFFISAIILAFVELLIVRPFHEEYITIYRNVKFLLVGLGVLTLVGNRVYLHYIIGREIGYKLGVKEMWDRIFD